MKRGLAIGAVLLVAIALVVPPVVAAAYATWDGRRPRALVLTAWLAAISLALVLVGSFVERTMGGERDGVPATHQGLVVEEPGTLPAAHDDRPPAEQPDRVVVTAAP